MNVHHLELFYYVAKFRGITPAVRKMPYGIQQPAVSGQILQLERDLGVKLFQRRPFALTPAGEELYDHISGFFSKLPQVAARLRGEESQHLRLAASAAVLTTHIPDILTGLRTEFPDLRLTLRDVPPSEVEPLLISQEIDVAITLLHQKLAAGVQAIELLRLPIMLVAHESSPVKRFSQIAKEGDVITEPLISMPPNETINQLFQGELEKRQLQWQPKVEVNSLDLVQSYAAHGYGLGLAVDIPGRQLAPELRRIPLSGFPPLRIALLHQGELNPVAQRFSEAVKAYASALTKQKKK
ncbi:MAG: DNA-binding transcriptional LysR family regulator [Verrucomicrobiales bacterium]|jgi:DNA-binding transcriptional LysR family regulator